MPDQNIHGAAGDPIFEDVRAMFKETALMIKESSRERREMSQETDREIREMSQETDRKIREMSQETDRKIKEIHEEIKQALKEASRVVGNLGNKLGVVVEHLVLANILEKFNALGYEFEKTVLNVRIEDKKKNIYTEVDAMLENGEFVLAIEVKTQLNVKDVDEHLERMDKLRRQADSRYERRKFLGAVAGAIVADNVKVYAQKNGFYVIKQSGDTVTIETPREFKPREW
ncbi:MAG: hypothetical protein LBQ88_16220 [Treponema sp.]|jgi:ElaB/YqjD/DUF883 family membrane-anchored ribosome-binding protein|nr:hypothetical protein [Treponema sp.]